MKIVQECEFVVAIHGEGSDKDFTYLGGLNQHLQNSLRDSLNKAGFKTAPHEDPKLQGRDKKNICNRGRSDCGGVQLELGRGLREIFFESLSAAGRKKPKYALTKFTAAIREGLAHAKNPHHD